MRLFQSKEEALLTIDTCYFELGIDKNSFDGRQQIDFLKLWSQTSTLNDFIEHFQEFYGCSRDVLDTLFYAYLILDDDTYIR